MGDIDDAAKRLEQAVARLEAAAKRGEGKPANPAPADATAMVAARLDEAILRIDRLLED